MFEDQEVDLVIDNKNELIKFLQDNGALEPEEKNVPDALKKNKYTVDTTPNFNSKYGDWFASILCNGKQLGLICMLCFLEYKKGTRHAKRCQLTTESTGNYSSHITNKHHKDLPVEKCLKTSKEGGKRHASWC